MIIHVIFPLYTSKCICYLPNQTVKATGNKANKSLVAAFPLINITVTFNFGKYTHALFELNGKTILPHW